jgi:hypothetical protein
MLIQRSTCVNNWQQSKTLRKRNININNGGIMKNYQQQVLDVISEAVRLAGSQNQLAEAMGTNRAKICKWLSGTSPTTKDFAALADYVGAQIIIPGQTTSVRTFARLLALEAEDASAHMMDKTLDESTPTSVLEYVAQRRHNEPSMLFHPSMLEKLGMDAADGILFTVPNDALQPTLRKGDQVLADRTDTRLEEGSLYLFHLPPSFTLRYASRTLEGLSLSASPTVAAMLVPPEREKELKILGRVVWVGKKL